MAKNDKLRREGERKGKERKRTHSLKNAAPQSNQFYRLPIFYFIVKDPSLNLPSTAF